MPGPGRQARAALPRELGQTPRSAVATARTRRSGQRRCAERQWTSVPSRAALPARDRGQDRHLVTVVHRRREAFAEANVLPAGVDVDEAAKLAVLGDPVPQSVITL